VAKDKTSSPERPPLPKSESVIAFDKIVTCPEPVCKISKDVPIGKFNI
jgi:hypothetical protein